MVDCKVVFVTGMAAIVEFVLAGRETVGGGVVVLKRIACIVDGLDVAVELNITDELTVIGWLVVDDWYVDVDNITVSVDLEITDELNVKVGLVVVDWNVDELTWVVEFAVLNVEGMYAVVENVIGFEDVVFGPMASVVGLNVDDKLVTGSEVVLVVKNDDVGILVDVVVCVTFVGDTVVVEELSDDTNDEFNEVEAGEDTVDELIVVETDDVTFDEPSGVEGDDEFSWTDTNEDTEDVFNEVETGGDMLDELNGDETVEDAAVELTGVDTGVDANVDLNGVDANEVGRGGNVVTERN